MKITTRHRISLTGLNRFKKAFRHPAAKREILGSWSLIYSRAMRDRFRKFSRGGGNWRKLAAATLKNRRARGNNSKLILQDTGLMLKSFHPRFVKSLVGGGDIIGIVSFGRTKRYPKGPTVSQVIALHNKGGGRTPKRQLLIQPKLKTRKRMGRVAARIAAKYLRD